MLLARGGAADPVRARALLDDALAAAQRIGLGAVRRGAASLLREVA